MPARNDPVDLPRASFLIGRAWFVCMVSPVGVRWDGRDFPAARAIEQLSFETYVPRATRKIIHRGRRIVRVSSLLGCYIFVRFDRERDDWGVIRRPEEFGKGGIDGVHGIIRDIFGNPCRVPDIQVDRLRRAEEAGAFDFTRQSAFSPGDTVRITEGPFAGFIAKVRSASPQKRVRLILGNLGEAQIDPAFIERLGRAERFTLVA